MDKRYLPAFDEGTGETEPPAENAEATAAAAELATLKAEHVKMQAALKKANAEAAKLRNESKAPDATKTTEQIERAAELDKLRGEIQVRDAIEALREAGVKGDRSKVAGMVKLLSTTAPDGLDDAVAELLELFPEFKGKAGDAAESGEPKPRVRTARGSASGTGDGKGKPPGGWSSATEAMMRAARR
jgi:hypothetical protein